MLETKLPYRALQEPLVDETSSINSRAKYEFDMVSMAVADQREKVEYDGKAYRLGSIPCLRLSRMIHAI